MLTAPLQGAMTFGEEGTECARIHDLKDVEKILDVFQARDHMEVSIRFVLALNYCKIAGLSAQHHNYRSIRLACTVLVRARNTLAKPAGKSEG